MYRVGGAGFCGWGSQGALWGTQDHALLDYDLTRIYDALHSATPPQMSQFATQYAVEYAATVKIRACGNNKGKGVGKKEYTEIARRIKCFRNQSSKLSTSIPDTSSVEWKQKLEFCIRLRRYRLENAMAIIERSMSHARASELVCQLSPRHSVTETNKAIELPFTSEAASSTDTRVASYTTALEKILRVTPEDIKRVLKDFR